MANKKLKCWKKEVNRKNFILYTNTKTGRLITSSVQTDQIWRSNLPIKEKEFKSKIKVDKQLKSWMHKHDKC